MPEEPGSDDLLPSSSGPTRAFARRISNPPYVVPAYHSPTRPQFTPPQPDTRHLWLSSPFSGSVSSFEGLSPAEVKKLQKCSRQASEQVDLIEDVVTRHTGERPEREQLMTSIQASLNAIPETRSFSALTSRDYLLLYNGSKGLIDVDHEALLAKVPLADIPEWFWGAQKSYRSCLSRRMELGVRQIIGSFLVAAVEIARNLFYNPRLALHCEWEVPLTTVPGIGKVHGPVDFVTASVSGGTDMGIQRPKFRSEV